MRKFIILQQSKIGDYLVHRMTDKKISFIINLIYFLVGGVFHNEEV